MSSLELRAFPILPRSRAGKVLLAVVLVAFVAIGLSVFGLVFNEPRLFGPFPESVSWHYFWYGVIYLVLVATYVLLFKPWADAAEDLDVADVDAPPEVEEPEVVSDD
ncbi:hypothetical protein [Halomarina ordinaria]|uniref:DUF3311 domain-containing protein n=1 Tax=Halomarina ordinaria TaxID=3033939 RepID=A0ABD5UG59_9EURY|nr:hypothetical protein [Halomarina sp. PSRA2]